MVVIKKVLSWVYVLQSVKDLAILSSKSKMNRAFLDAYGFGDTVEEDLFDK